MQTQKKRVVWTRMVLHVALQSTLRVVEIHEVLLSLLPMRENCHSYVWYVEYYSTIYK